MTNSIISWKPNVIIVLFLAGALLGDELASNNPVVHVSAMIVKLPSSTIGPGVNLKATPAIHGSRIQISIEVSHSELIERQAIPEAPGFQAGCPQMSIFTVSANTVLSDGATCVVAGSSTENSRVLCFVTVQLDYTANMGQQLIKETSL